MIKKRKIEQGALDGISWGNGNFITDPLNFTAAPNKSLGGQIVRYLILKLVPVSRKSVQNKIPSSASMNIGNGDGGREEDY